MGAGPATYAGVFVVASTTLMYQVAVAQIIRVTMGHPFALVAVSVGLFGTTVGALLVHLRPEWFREAMVKRQMARWSLLFAVSIAAAIFLLLAVPLAPGAGAVGVVSVVCTCVVVAVPFVGSGVVVCLALTRFAGRVTRFYASYLVGAGVGSGVLVVAWEVVDGPSLVVAVAAVGAVLLAADAGSRRGRRWGAAALVALSVLSAGNAYLHSQGRPILEIRSEAGERDDTGDPDGTDQLRSDITNLAYHAREGVGFANAAVIGVDGRRDVLAALEFGAGHVTGIEANGDIPGPLDDTLANSTAQVDQNPRVDLVDEAAHTFLARSDEQFDTIQISSTDTATATAAGASALDVSPQYTTEAWQTFLDRLQPGGILSVSQRYRDQTGDPLEILRTTALAAQVLHERGVAHPRAHILIYEGPMQSLGQNVATVLVSPEPFDVETITRLDDVAEASGFTAVLTPALATDDRFVDLTSGRGPDRAVDTFVTDISPPTDERPFFFQMASLGSIMALDGLGQDGALAPMWTLLALLVAVVLLAAVCIGGPLRHRAATGNGHAHRTMRPHYVYFAGTGMGFMLVQYSVLQRLGPFVGDRTQTLSVVLPTVLVFGGVGSLLAERLVDTARTERLLRPLAALLALVVAFGRVAPAVVDAAAAETTSVRIAIAVCMLAPLALLTGMPLVIGMAAAGRSPGAPTALLWGINGAMSAVGSVLGVVVAALFGITVALVCGCVAYALAASSLWWAIGDAPDVTDVSADVSAEVSAAARTEVLEPVPTDAHVLQGSPG